MVESNVKSLVLFTTGRGIDLVIWEIKNQTSYAGVPLLSFTTINGDYEFPINFVDQSSTISGKETSRTVTSSSTGKFKDALFKATFQCTQDDIHILKEALGNCILLRSAYEIEVASAVGTDLLWNILSEKGLSSSVTGTFQYNNAAFFNSLHC